MFGAFSSLKSQMLAQSIGKRGLLLGSSLLMLLSSIWTMHVVSSYAEFMISRILTGMAWGGIEGLMVGSINDIFFVHQPHSKSQSITNNPRFTNARLALTPTTSSHSFSPGAPRFSAATSLNPAKATATKSW